MAGQPCVVTPPDLQEGWLGPDLVGLPFQGRNSVASVPGVFSIKVGYVSLQHASEGRRIFHGSLPVKSPLSSM